MFKCTCRQVFCAETNFLFFPTYVLCSCIVNPYDISNGLAVHVDGGGKRTALQLDVDTRKNDAKVIQLPVIDSALRGNEIVLFSPERNGGMFVSPRQGSGSRARNGRP